MVRLTGPALGRTALQSGQSAEAQSMQLSSNEGWGTSGSPAARRLSLVPLQVDSKATLGLGVFQVSFQWAEFFCPCFVAASHLQQFVAWIK